MKASITLLIILAATLVFIIVAINKGLIAYFLTDNPLLGWLVYRKNDPKNRLK